MPETTTEPTALADLAARWERKSAEYLTDWQDYDAYDGQERRGQGIALGDAASELRAALAAAPADRESLVSIILDCFRSHPGGGSWQTLAEWIADALFREGLVSPDDAHTETVTEYRVLALHIKSGEVIPLTDDGEPRAKAMDRAKACRDAGFLRARVESRTVTTSRRESEWKATDQ